MNAGDAPATASVSWRRASFAVLDLETTGLDAAVSEIISWGVVPVERGRVRIGGVRSGLVKPAAMPAGDTIRIHGLRPADLEAAPGIASAVDALRDVLDGRHVVAHAAFVERAFLREAGLTLREPILDTATLGAVWLQTRGKAVPRMVSLSGLAAELGLPVHRPHRADADALTTAQAFVALASHFEAAGVTTVKALERVSTRGRIPRRWTLRRRTRSGRIG